MLQVILPRHHFILLTLEVRSSFDETFHPAEGVVIRSERFIDLGNLRFLDGEVTSVLRLGEFLAAL